MKSVYIVAEIGCNHNGDVSLAKKMVAAAKSCGVDAVKFQTFRADRLISRYAPKAEYQKKTTGTVDSQLEMTRRLELSPKEYLMLRDYAEGMGLDVFSTAFDLPSIDFLQKSGQCIWKIPSGEITNLPYLERIRDLRCKEKKVILSTGMATMEEIEAAVSVLDLKEHELILLHCNTEYPTQDDDVNVSAIRDLQQMFPHVPVGFSDHSIGEVAAILSVAYHACMIEKHFTLSKELPGPDHKASATPDELKRLVQGVRRAEKITGIGKKYVTDSERKNIIAARKSIVADAEIQRGERFTTRNVTCKRPGNGLSPMQWYRLLGNTARRHYDVDELIRVDEVYDDIKTEGKSNS